MLPKVHTHHSVSLRAVQATVERLERTQTLPTTDSERMAVYLSVLAKSGKQRRAQRAAGLEPVTLWRLRRDYDGFDAAEQAALQSSAFLLEDEAFRRAVTGVEKAIYRKGEVVGTEKVYSDTLLVRLLAARNPAFGDRTAVSLDAKIEQTGDVADVANVSRLTALLDAVRRRRNAGATDIDTGADLA